MNKLSDKRIIGCIRMDKEPVAADQIIQMENTGADSVLLIDDSMPVDEERLIKLIKAVGEKSDMPLLIKRHYQRLEDVKKILYAGDTQAVMDVVSAADFHLMVEASERFGKDKILAWIPESQPVTDALASAVQQNGASACVVENRDTELFGTYHLPVLPVRNMTDAKEIAAVLEPDGVWGIISEKFYTDQMDLMSLKYELGSMGIATNRFESQIPFSEFKLNSDGLIPVVTQEYKTGKVLMVAYMNEEAFNETIRSGRMTYWSRSRQELWKKGDTSGHYQYVKSLDIDCDKDTILAKVVQIGAACHTGNESCFFTNLVSKSYDTTNPMTIFDEVMATILHRKENPKEGSYTNYLFDKGIDKILKKVGEEATEIVIAAKNPDSDELKYEICDFLYHMMVLMAERGVTWKEITKELAGRH
ncbi:bifunctional phosphoribosyl-AMP cyclohydrolase/phosphoribosyl-ATP diphosphatase HisIE [Frisingicoccus sp.]|uniref:bifunctional phosphoribosyl-AMP cyclohydrolase/phosphoribosyl-ATP diphosphatase HisIE n=1 Tax=Frisingicoccus sp. TaxID=1918627 RepID=UPI003999506F